MKKGCLFSLGALTIVILGFAIFFISISKGFSIFLFILACIPFLWYGLYQLADRIKQSRLEEKRNAESRARAAANEAERININICTGSPDGKHDYHLRDGKCYEVCSNCDITRNIPHSWKDGKCTRCSTPSLAVLREQHQAASVTVTRSRECRAGEHNWVRAKVRNGHGYMNGFRCTICGKTRVDVNI